MKTALLSICMLFLLLAGCQTSPATPPTPGAQTSAPTVSPSPTQPPAAPTAHVTPTVPPSPTVTPVDIAGTKRLVSPNQEWIAIFHPQDASVAVVDRYGKPAGVYHGDPGFQPEWLSLGGWSPDSRRFMFWQGTTSASLQADGLPLWVFDVDRGKARQISESVLVNPAYLSWSPDGRALAFSNGGYRSALAGKHLTVYWAELDQVVDLVPVEELITGALAWSSDGAQIVVSAVDSRQVDPDSVDFMGWENPGIAARRIYSVDPKTGTYRLLAASNEYQDTPRWSADGKTLFYVQKAGDQAQVMSLNMQSGSVQVVLGCQAAIPPAAVYYGQVDWTRLYASCANTGPLLYERPVDDLIQVLYASYPSQPRYDPASPQYAAFPQALKQLEAMGPRAIDAASHIAITIGSAREDAYLAAQTLLSLGPDITRLTLPILIDLLQSGRPEARMNAALLIGTGDEASSCATGKLGPLLWDSDPQVRYAAAFALEKLTGADLLPDDLMTLPDPLIRTSIPKDVPEGTLVGQARTWWTEKGSAVNWHPSYGACDP